MLTPLMRHLINRRVGKPTAAVIFLTCLFLPSFRTSLTQLSGMFFLNRTNHSGILNGGMIGGRAQKGTWKVGARFNKPELLRRIKRIGSYKNRIHLTQLDAIDFLNQRKPSRDSLVYLDPPYYRAGARLYLNAYRPDDHAEVRKSVRELAASWVVSYDDVPAIRKLYKSVRARHLSLQHTARCSKIGKEVLFFSPRLKIPVYR